MNKICRKCGKAFDIYPIPSEEFIAQGNEKFCYPRFFEDKEYISFKCDRCKTINSYIIK